MNDITLQQKTNKGILTVLAVTAALLLVPLVAMQLTGEVVWTLSDFVAAGILIAGTGLAFVFATRKISTTWGKARVGAGLALLFLIIWVELAVGIFD
jgi:hypothetical protein